MSANTAFTGVKTFIKLVSEDSVQSLAPHLKQLRDVQPWAVAKRIYVIFKKYLDNHEQYYKYHC